MAEAAAVATEKGVAQIPPDAAALARALPDAMLVVDPDDVVRYLNPAAEQFFGAGAAVLCDRRLDSLLQFDSPLVALIAKVRDGLATITEYGVDMLSPHRRPRAVDAQVTALPDTAGWVVVGLRERTIAQKLDRQLSHLGAGRSVAGLAAALAHEVKNPLSGIRGAAQLLEQNAGPGDRELTALIVEESDRICRLVDRMEMFSDSHPIERGAVNIHEVLEHVRRLVQSGFGGSLRFVERYDPSLPPVFGNRDQLVQVFLNLIKNAAEAAIHGGGEIVLATHFEAGLRLSVASAGERLWLPLVAIKMDVVAGPFVAQEKRIIS